MITVIHTTTEESERDAMLVISSKMTGLTATERFSIKAVWDGFMPETDDHAGEFAVILKGMGYDVLEVTNQLDVESKFE